ncbi:uncharacterized protein KY384_005622 [Bacidia gigantensis]|uniref:uncharacterized protein n=1 Tax=Bacidia gigantensis TaxID=2732470 RepID=UPI001D053E08|nr:uncharacterized protein KY384_005622 [Bacidia gigantensis]KAG8530139.1 hypothetical protein KY384_005622 [Bacidia gigantensis]
MPQKWRESPHLATAHIDPKSIVGSLFGTGATKPKESKPKDTPSKEVRPKEPPRRDSRSKETKPKEPKPEKKYDCMICCDPFPRHKVHIQKPCNHIMCNSCLRNMFTNSLQDPTQMPPACCSKDNPIDPHHAGSLFDLAFKRKWNRKYVEFTTQNRIYCPRKGCGKFIHPSNIYVDHSGGANTGRKFGICSRCDTKVCKTCAQKWHTSKECPKDETLKEFQRMADKEGWRKCYNCRATVELAVGCNHMTCRCGAQFCMVCGLKWHTCECSMFTDDMIEQDRLEHERNPRAGLDRLWEEARHQDDEEDEELARRLARHLWDEDLDDWGGGRDQFRDGPPPPRPVPAPNHDPAANEARRGRPRDDDLYRRGIDILTGAFTEGNNAAAEQLVQEIRVHVRQPRVYDVPLPNTHPSPNRRHLSPRPAPPRPPVRRGSIYPGRGVPADTYARGRGLGQGQGMGDVPTVMDFLDPEQDAAEVEGREARRRASMLAGIHRGQQGGGRVEEWRRHVAVA